MISLKIYRYILIIIILLCILGLVLVFRNKKLNLQLKIGSVWVLILLLLNFANMFYTLKYYDDNKDVKGPKGPKGDIGNVGLKGADYVCADPTCKGDATDEIKYGTNMREINGEFKAVLDDPEIKIGKCIFPYIHDGSLKYDETDEPRKDGMVSDGFWCPTSLKNDRTYKTYGYTNYSELEAKSREENRLRSQKRSEYIRNNTGILDIKLIAGNRSTEPCPGGYKKIDKDLNEEAGGKYLFLCTKRGLGSTGISELTVAPPGDNNFCDPSEGFRRIQYNLNKDTDDDRGTDLNLCFKKSNTNFIKDLKVLNSQALTGEDSEYAVENNINYDIVNTTEKGTQPKNLNEGTVGKDIYLFFTKDAPEYISIDAGFVFSQDKKLYLFKNENYYIYDDKKDKVGEGKSIKEDWGIDLDGGSLDAVFTYGFNKKIYFFQGSLCYEYDEKRQEIAAGFPKYIVDYWKGIPDNIDSVFTYAKDGKTYFFKGRFVYKYDDRANKIARGYPQLIKNVFASSGSEELKTVDAAFSHSDGQTYLISGNKYFVLGSDSQVLSDYPRDINNKFLIPV